MSDTLLEVKNLKKYFKVSNGNLHAVDDVSFNVNRGQTIGIVGESGCGKSTLGRSILRILEPTSGEVLFNGKDITTLKPAELRGMRQEMQIIFQDPYSSLDPRMSVFELIAEPLKLNKLCANKSDMKELVKKYMALAGLSERLINCYPHELDGGRRQRIGIARALILEPRLIVCDEPVSALDVSIQAQILNLLQDLQKSMGLTYIFITHDLSVVKHISDEIIVMYLGKIVERAPAEELFSNPLHPYTKALLRAIPTPDYDDRDKEFEIIEGEVTSPINPDRICRFEGRCKDAMSVCRAGEPKLLDVGNNHFVSCFGIK